MFINYYILQFFFVHALCLIIGWDVSAVTDMSYMRLGSVPRRFFSASENVICSPPSLKIYGFRKCACQMFVPLFGFEDILAP